MSFRSGTLSSSENSRIQDWLDRITPGTASDNEDYNRTSRPLKRKRATRSCSPPGKLLTPPESQRRQYAMPSQTEHTQRLIDVDEDGEAPLNGGESCPILYPQSSVSQTCPPLLKRRRTNPSRKSLQWLGKPVNYDKKWNLAQQLPRLRGDTTLDDLMKTLWAIDAGSAFIPKGVETKVRQHLDQKGSLQICDLNIYDDPRPKRDLKLEFSAIERALRDQDTVEEYHANEPSWGERVWAPVLACAVQPVPDVSWHNVTTALIEKDFQPTETISDKPAKSFLSNVLSQDTSDVSTSSANSDSDSTASGNRLSQKVDYAISITPKKDAAAAIRRIVTKYNIMGHPATINQTLQFELLERPIAIAIEGKTPEDTTGQKAMQQLATWTAAWYRRMETLQAHNMVEKTANKPLMYLPLIKIHGRLWWLYFAIDDVASNEICISKAPGMLGDTETMYNTYKLVASLRALLKWVDGPYRAWWDEMLGVATSHP